MVRPAIAEVFNPFTKVLIRVDDEERATTISVCAHGHSFGA